MRLRAVFLVAAALLVLLVPAVLQHSASKLAATSYPAGWNLVSGPEGSTLSGASGSLYSIQPGDSAYETIPAATPLHACWGYWAYFPNGGSLAAGTDSARCSLTGLAGAWVMVGNP